MLTTIVTRFRLLTSDDSGMTTIEYALGAVAATALAGALYLVASSGVVADALEGIITNALNNAPGK